MNEPVRFREEGAANASSPNWERASGLSAAGSLRPRRLGRKGEGPDLSALTEALVSVRNAPGPSPGLPKLASSLRQTVLSQWGEGRCGSVGVLTCSEAVGADA